MMENVHYIFDSMLILTKNYEKTAFLESSMATLKKTYDEHLDSYIKTTLYYACPTLKDFK